MGVVLHTLMGVPGYVPPAPANLPDRAQSRRWDNQLARPNRVLVSRASQGSTAGRSAPAGDAVTVPAVMPATPFLMRTAPRTRIGPVPKLAPGKQGSGLGQRYGAGFQTLLYTGLTPLENSPSTQENSRAISIPRNNVVAWDQGGMLRPSYKAHDFAPATRFFNQARSAGMWSQGQFPPQQRPLIPPVQSKQLRIPAQVVRRQVPAGQVNAALYTAGYPTRVGVAAQIGGGPIAVLGGGY